MLLDSISFNRKEIIKMIDKVIYAIATEQDEYRRTEDEWFDSFEDAMANRMKYANWFRPKGNVWICKHNGSPRVSEEWLINETGEVESHYDWDEYRNKNKK